MYSTSGSHELSSRYCFSTLTDILYGKGDGGESIYATVFEGEKGISILIV